MGHLLQYGSDGRPEESNFVFTQSTVDPTAANDSSQGYGIGSRWSNTTTGLTWECHDATVSVAVWELGVTSGNGNIDGGAPDTNYGASIQIDGGVP